MSNYAPSEKWEKASKDTALAPDEYVWKPNSPGTEHSFTLKCSGNLMRTVGKGFEKYHCPECGFEYELST